MASGVMTTVGLGDIVPQGEQGQMISVIFGWILTGSWSTAVAIDLLILVLYIQLLSAAHSTILSVNKPFYCLLLLLLLTVIDFLS